MTDWFLGLIAFALIMLPFSIPDSRALASIETELRRIREELQKIARSSKL